MPNLNNAAIDEFYGIMSDIAAELKAIRKIFNKATDAFYLIAEVQNEQVNLIARLTAKMENKE